MGTVVHLKKKINNSYEDLRNSVEDKLFLVEEKIKSKLTSKVELLYKMTDYHMKTGGKRLRALLTLESAKLCGYKKGGKDINLAELYQEKVNNKTELNITTNKSLYNYQYNK